MIDISNIDELPFNEAIALVLKICNSETILSISEIRHILNAKEKELVNVFFDEYKYFSKKDFLFIESFINENLDYENKDFVSDLIYFAVDFGLDLEYRKIISFLTIEKEDENCLVLSCLQYLNMNIKFLYLGEIIPKLEYITEKTIYHQNEQLLASLILYRMTHKTSYLKFVKDLIDFDKSNLIFFKNVLNSDMYNGNYFDLTDIHNYFGKLLDDWEDNSDIM